MATESPPGLHSTSRTEMPRGRSGWRGEGMRSIFSISATAAAIKERFAKSQPLPAGEPPRDDSVVEALAAEERASDPTSDSRDPPSFRVPAGAVEDLFYTRIGRPLFNASSIYSPTLVVA